MNHRFPNPPSHLRCPVPIL
uniref:Uncharacterized protein n=1 Tax=Arundo donax TaxID=35708 RepID=A0A0A9AHH4_ARUDO